MSDVGYPFDDIIEAHKSAINLKRPKEFGEEIDFPTDPTILSIDDLGKYMMKLTAYRGYVMYQLAIAETRYTGVKSLYEDELRKTSVPLEKKSKTQNALLSEAYAANPDLFTLKSLMDRMGAEVSMMDRFSKIYELQIVALSRELSRRQVVVEERNM